jgi:hypothetical protein
MRTNLGYFQLRRYERTGAMLKKDGWAIVLFHDRTRGIHNAGKLVPRGIVNSAEAENVGFWHDHDVARHKRADIGNDDEALRFMQNAGIDIRINKVGQPATL